MTCIGLPRSLANVVPRLEVSSLGVWSLVVPGLEVPNLRVPGLGSGALERLWMGLLGRETRVRLGARTRGCVVSCPCQVG